MINFRQIQRALLNLEIDPQRPVIVHADMGALGEISGGSATLLGALQTVLPRLIMPAFTPQTMLIPEIGPEYNAIVYSAGTYQNQAAAFFHPNLPVSPNLGPLPEIMRQQPQAERSLHPLLSFSGVQVNQALSAQTIQKPLAPIDILAQQGGYALLLGSSHTDNFSLHYGEQLAGRQGFTRWALTPFRIEVCPHIPGCSDGFTALDHNPTLGMRSSRIGVALIRAYPLSTLLAAVQTWLEKDPLALLCEDPNCSRCNVVRRRAG